MHLGSTEEEQSPRLSSFKINEPRIRSVIYMDYSFSQIGYSLHFSAVNGSFEAY